MNGWMDRVLVLELVDGSSRLLTEKRTNEITYVVLYGASPT